MLLSTGNSSLNGSSDGCPWRGRFVENHRDFLNRWQNGGIFVESDLNHVNCFWLQFDPAPLGNHLALAGVMLLIFIVGCASNAVVIYILSSTRHLRTPANIIVINLAISDFLMLAKSPVFIYNSLLQGPALGHTGCQVYGFLGGLTGCGSIISLAAVAADRYLVICKPLKVDETMTKKRAHLLVLLIWAYSAAFACPPFFGVGDYVPEGYLTSCSFDYISEDLVTRVYIVALFFACWVIPFVVIIGCYAAIVRYVHQVKRELELLCNRKPINEVQMKIHKKKWRRCNAEWSITKVTMRLVAVWLVAWTPYAVVALVGVSGNAHSLTPGVTMFPALLAKLSAAANPFIYALNHPKIKGEIVWRWNCVESAGGSPAQSNASCESPLIRFRSRKDSQRPQSVRQRMEAQSSINRRPIPLANTSRRTTVIDIVNGAGHQHHFHALVHNPEALDSNPIQTPFNEIDGQNGANDGDGNRPIGSDTRLALNGDCTQRLLDQNCPTFDLGSIPYVDEGDLGTEPTEDAV